MSFRSYGAGVTTLIHVPLDLLEPLPAGSRAFLASSSASGPLLPIGPV
jgi:hypothetical protein